MNDLMKHKFINKKIRSDVYDDNGILFSKITNLKTCEVADFYTVSPFPNYEGFENKLDLSKTLINNSFLKDFKQTIGYGKSFLEVGSGTSQLSIAMATGTNNLIVALDPTLASLKLGNTFAQKNNVKNIKFFKADIFENPITSNYFDYVWCSGVLHHTNNPQQAFKIIAHWVKPGGLIIIGLYNKYGRLRTNFRQFLYNFFRKSKLAKSIIFLFDPHLRKNLSHEKKTAWFRDQYEHPIESKHTIDEVISWFDKNNISFRGSLPSPDLETTKNLSEMDGIKMSWFSRIIAQISMLFNNQGSEGGLFLVIGKKNKNIK